MPSHRIGCRYQRPPAAFVVMSAARRGSTMPLCNDPGSDHSNFIVVQPVTPRRHHAAPTVADRRGDALEIAAVQPDVIREIRRAESRVAATIDAMACDAHGLEARLARIDPILWRPYAAQAQH